MTISRVTLVNIAPRRASAAPFWRLIWDHFEWPDIGPDPPARPRRYDAGPSLCPPPGAAAVPSDPSRRTSQPMQSVDLPHLRNVVIAAHAGAGKTTLAEHLLHEGGAIARMGRVDDGTASLDFEPEEQKRHISLSLAVASFDHAEHRITLIDTPGYADFQAEGTAGFAPAAGAGSVLG